jgi:hypothetical protein
LLTPSAARRTAEDLRVLAELVPVVVGGRGAERYRKEFAKYQLEVLELRNYQAWIRENARAGETTQMKNLTCSQERSV